MLRTHDGSPEPASSHGRDPRLPLTSIFVIILQLVVKHKTDLSEIKKVKKFVKQQKKELDIPDTPDNTGSWSVWECAPSIFDWHYDSVEKAYVYEGKVKVKTEQEEVEIKAGDFVTFPEDLDCTWEIQEKIRKVYKFE